MSYESIFIQIEIKKRKERQLFYDFATRDARFHVRTTKRNRTLLLLCNTHGVTSLSVGKLIVALTLSVAIKKGEKLIFLFIFSVAWRDAVNHHVR